jgi:DivIVA domain-containing protein
MPRTKSSEPDPQSSSPPGESHRLTPVDIQQKEFRESFRGYNEREVDVFLDQLTEEIARLHAENKRLREEMELRGLAGGGEGESTAILERAREEANRILAAARAEAAATPPSGGSPEDAAGGGALPRDEAASARTLIGSFLSRERQFLQSLAGLIQEHAVSVRDEAGRARDQIAASVGGSAAEGPEPPRQRPPQRSAPEGGPPPASRTAPSSPPSDLPRSEPMRVESASSPEHSTESSAAGDTATWARSGSVGGDRTETAWRPFEGAPGGAASRPPEAAPNQPGMDPEAAMARTRPGAEEPEDRSIQELFWGEG